MPTVLKVIDFEAALLPLVRDFDCTPGPATEFWEKEINDWIRMDPATGDGALYRMAHGTQVWLYANADDEVVGYGSLGRSSWPDPSAEAWSKRLPRKPISIIPAVGLDRRFQGCPTDAEKAERYSAKIMRHLMSEAERHTDRLPYLGLYVHPANLKAISFYKRIGFIELAGQVAKNPEAGVDYPGMILKLALAAPAAGLGDSSG